MFMTMILLAYLAFTVTTQFAIIQNETEIDYTKSLELDKPVLSNMIYASCVFSGIFESQWVPMLISNANDK